MKTLTRIAGCLLGALFPLQSFALHDSPITFPNPVVHYDEYGEWYDHSPLTIQYCHPTICPEIGFLAMGAIVSGWFEVNESPVTDFGSAPFSAADIDTYSIYIGAGSTYASLTQDNTHLGDGGLGPATAWYFAGIPTIESGGTLWRNMWLDRNGFVDGQIELTALAPGIGSDIGLKYYFDLSNRRMDVYALMNPFATDLSTGVLVASTAVVPLPGAAWFFLSGLVALLVSPRRRKALPQ